MGIMEYCESLQEQLTAWSNNVQLLLQILENLPSTVRQADARQIENLQEIIQRLGKVMALLREKCYQ